MSFQPLGTLPNLRHTLAKNLKTSSIEDPACLIISLEMSEGPKALFLGKELIISNYSVF